MNEEQINNIVAGLLKKTSEGKAVWMQGSARNQYKIQFNKGAIVVTKYKKEANGSLVIDFNIMNEKGDSIFMKKVNELAYEFVYYNELFETVNKKYFRIDETLEDIIKAINGNDEIGRDTSNDLPF